MMKIVIFDVRRGIHELTNLEFTGTDVAVFDEFQRIFEHFVSIEETCFEVQLLDEHDELLEVGGIDVRGYTMLNEAPPPYVQDRIQLVV
jgi:hypothetical protein